eukprot:TRINITY_DN50908_c0_g1_i1.p1 TRINITY_DN50908_c0_g1~~TRINITY_DN50908_c0_g1_i1.p1  ORF type:complete len:149 (-),score=40.99 TRINITY_DN50908_c0_g1_i1:82-501(-)
MSGIASASHSCRCTAVVSLLLAFWTASTQETVGEAFDLALTYLDKDQDGRLSLEEVMSQSALDPPSQASMKKDFVKADLNRDGVLNAEEHASFVDAQNKEALQENKNQLLDELAAAGGNARGAEEAFDAILNRLRQFRR